MVPMNTPMSDTLPQNSTPPGLALPVGVLVTTVLNRDAASDERNRAFAELVRRFQDMAFGVAFSILGDTHQAEDAAQDAFVTAWRNLENLREPDAFPGWFQQVVRSSCHRMTRGKRLPTVALSLLGDAIAPNSDPLYSAETHERQIRVRSALAALPEHERTATTLYYLGEFDQAEIAEFLGVPVTTIKKRIFSARKRLRKHLTPYVTAEVLPQLEPKLMETNENRPVETTRLLRETLSESLPSNDPTFARTVALWTALEDGESARIADLLEEAPELVHIRDSRDESPLHRAACYGHLEAVGALLTRSADPNLRAANGTTPLHSLAAGSTRIEIAERLLASGADLNAKDESGRTALQIAARRAVPLVEDECDGFALADFLLSRGASSDIWTDAALDRNDAISKETTEKLELSATNPEGETPLHLAARAGYRKTVKALLDAGADVNAKDAAGRTPLSVATQPGHNRFLPPHAPVVTLLTEQGGILEGDLSPSPSTDEGQSPTHQAAAAGDVGTLRGLLAKDSLVARARDTHRETPLHLAAGQGRDAAVRALLDAGAFPNATADDGGTPLHRAALSGQRATVVLLLSRGADAKWINFRGETPLLSAASQDDVELARALLDAGSPVGTIGSGGTSALHIAAERGHVAVVRLLVEHGADTEARNYWGGTPLQVAVRAGQTEVARILLAAGAERLTRDNWHRTPLHTAIWAGHLEVVRLLLDNGIALTELSYGYSTPLHTAAGAGHTAIAELLIQRGGVVNAASDFKRTPLHDAVHGGHMETVRLLLAHGADPNHANDRGSTPLHWAAAAGNREIANLLLAAGADRTLKSAKDETPHDLAERYGHKELANLLAPAPVITTG